MNESLWGTLWPDESAWRLKLQMKRALHFDAGEMVTFTNLPIPVMGTTNTTPITRTVGGIQVVLTEFFHGSDTLRNGSGYTPGTSRIRVELPGKPAGMALDFLNMTIDAATTEPIHYSPLDSALVIFLQSMPTNAHTADITWVVQKTRTVEFMIKPPSRNEKKP